MLSWPEVGEEEGVVHRPLMVISWEELEREERLTEEVVGEELQAMWESSSPKLWGLIVAVVGVVVVVVGVAAAVVPRTSLEPE